jgi:hypothetical protein
MKNETALAIADVVLLAAAGGVAWVILRNPRLRRPALRLLWTFATGTVPVYLGNEIRTAWRVSGERNQRGMMTG